MTGTACFGDTGDYGLLSFKFCNWKDGLLLTVFHGLLREMRPKGHLTLHVFSHWSVGRMIISLR